MFEPVYQVLRRMPELWLGLSSGRYRRRFFKFWKNPATADFNNERIYGEFDIDPRHLIKTGVRDPRSYDVFVTSNLDSRMQPKNSKTTVQIFHGVSFRNFAVQSEYARFQKLFFPGRYMLEQYIARGILTEGDPRIELIGMPKLDRLVNGTFNRDEILRGLGLDPAVPTVLWCPTGARHNSFEILGHEGVRAIESTGFNLILKLHDHPHLRPGTTEQEIADHARAGLGGRGRLATHSDVTPLLVAADLLVSDASSVAYEYCLRDRPIVFVDVPQLLGERASMQGSSMDMNTHGRGMGRIVNGAEELAVAVKEEMAEPGRLSAKRRAAAQHIFHEPGGATERVASRLMQLAGYAPSGVAAPSRILRPVQ